jgi:hypothetical protein
MTREPPVGSEKLSKRQEPSRLLGRLDNKREGGDTISSYFA